MFISLLLQRNRLLRRRRGLIPVPGRYAQKSEISLCKIYRLSMRICMGVTLTIYGTYSVSLYPLALSFVWLFLDCIRFFSHKEGQGDILPIAVSEGFAGFALLAFIPCK